MRIYDLFYEMSTILGGIENKSYQLLDKVNGDNEEKYVITKKKFNAKNLTKFEDQDAEDENRIIQCMKSISNHRFQNLSEVRDFRSQFQITSSNSIRPIDKLIALFIRFIGSLINQLRRIKHTGPKRLHLLFIMACQ